MAPAVIAVLVCVPAGSGATRVSAQETASGAWQAGATTMDVAVESWGPDCGPRPQSTRSAGGGRVEVQQTGDVLVIKGRDRDVRSDRCWSPNPAVKKVGSSRNRNTWITRCKTAAADPRQEHASYTLRLESDDQLLYEDVSHFDWKLKSSTCVATITTRQTLQRTAPGANPAAPGSTPPAPGTKPGTPPAKPGVGGISMPSTPPPGSRAPTPPPATGKPAQPTCVAGKPARLSLRPRSADIELGGRTCFEARVTDAKNCPVLQPAVRWSLDHKPGIRGRLENGCFRAEEGSAEGEGTFTVAAALGALHASAQVEVSASTLPALIARRLQGGAIEGEELGDGGVAAPDAAVPALATAVASPKPPAARVVAHTVAVPQEAGRVSLGMAAIAAGVLAFALLVAIVVWRMRRPGPAQRRSYPSEPPGRAPKTATMAVRSLRCPRCGAFYPEGSAFCGNDGSALEPTR